MEEEYLYLVRFWGFTCLRMVQGWSTRSNRITRDSIKSGMCKTSRYPLGQSWPQHWVKVKHGLSLMPRRLRPVHSFVLSSFVQVRSLVLFQIYLTLVMFSFGGLEWCKITYNIYVGLDHQFSYYKFQEQCRQRMQQ